VLPPLGDLHRIECCCYITASIENVPAMGRPLGVAGEGAFPIRLPKTFPPTYAGPMSNRIPPIFAAALAAVVLAGGGFGAVSAAPPASPSPQASPVPGSAPQAPFTPSQGANGQAPASQATGSTPAPASQPPPLQGRPTPFQGFAKQTPTPKAQASSIGIGAGEEPPTHLSFSNMPKDAKIVWVSTHLIVDKASPNGLNFFAIQVNFPNKTWAHGGPQLVKKGNQNVQQVNWGGLVNRGGGAKDYKETDLKSDLLLIESGVGKPNTVPWRWKLNTEYVLTVERGKQVQLPAGESHNVHVDARTMWEWKFTFEPVVKDVNLPTYTALIYDAADSIGSFYLWIEAGYGSTKDEQHALWSPPTYRLENSTADKVAREWKRF